MTGIIKVVCHIQVKLGSYEMILKL